MSRDALEGAQLLLLAENFRGCASRAYYSAYCAVAGELVKRRVTFPHGWNNPGHDQLPDLVLNHLAYSLNTRFEINKALRRLRKGREDADYRPRAAVGEADAVNLT
jgi:uncharacterized protein (UPF0332 family)